MQKHRALSVIIRLTALTLSMLVATDCSNNERTNNSDATTSTTQLAKTAILHIQPVDDHGQLKRDFTVRDTVGGADCSSGSEKVAGPPHRCMADNGVYDPCWSETSGQSVVCMESPWSREVTRLLTKRKVSPEPSSPDSDEPWGVELGDGKRCGLFAGSHDSVGTRDEDVIDYYCDEEGHSPDLALLRGINKTNPVWVARAARHIDDHYERVDPQPIMTAWVSS